ncbi:hypothetical protein O6H91_09G086600 [Diphasiastrum complanatum]|uniref:Uncharacterized protein n=1 Tax=Diphasiastrum complanatum TaxID=34168 RepID=A0ACC2CRQ0_DIPCM|nr:hypothetical protein O6H91_09G086600 [Diphasiastrum complanatum]
MRRPARWVLLLFMKVSIASLLLLFFFTLPSSAEADPTPQPWPPQFHSLMFQNFSGSLSIIDLWYDWPNGRNFNIIRSQLGGLLYDLEWNNGTSYFYDLQKKTCKTIHFGVGILRRNWLENATYLGVQAVDNFTCNVWTKADFIWYYEDVASKRPVHWTFFDGMSLHIMTFELGRVLPDRKWQAPSYCFNQNKTGQKLQLLENVSSRGMLSLVKENL